MAENYVSADAVGKIIQATGDAFAVSGSDMRPLTEGSEIFKGDTLVTQSGGALEVLFRDHTALSQGENSEIRVDNYVYDASDPSGSDLLLNMTKGVFRTVTGEIAEKNPDHFKLSSPLATIGIRGTTVVSEVRDGAEKHGVEAIGAGKVLVVQDALGNIQFISEPKFIIDFLAGQPIRAARPLTQQELDFFHSQTPITDGNDGGGDNGQGEGDNPGEGSGEDTGDGQNAGDGDTGEDGLDGGPVTVLGMIDFEDLAGPKLYVTSDLNPKVTLVPRYIAPSPPSPPEPPPPSDPGPPKIYGTPGNDFLKGTSASEYINGLDGHDTLNGMAGNDTLDGGNTQKEYPNDEAFYHEDPAGISVSLRWTSAGGYAGSTARDGWGDTDTLINIGGIVGSAHADSISIIAQDVGTADDIHWYAMGMEGNDTISGSASAGDESIATVYVKDPAGVTVDLENGVATDGWGNTDTLVNVRVVCGSNYADVLNGSNNANGDTFVLTLGNDTINGLGSDKDEVDFVFMDNQSGWGWGYVDLSSGTAVGYNSGGTTLFTDTLTNIEDIGGSKGSDTLLGNGADNKIDGFEGNDYISGGSGGIDSFYGGLGNDIFKLMDGANVDTIMDFTIHSTKGNDKIQFSQTDLAAYSVDGGTLMASGSAGANLSGQVHNIINVLDHADASFSNAASVINGVVDITGSTERTYFLISNGTNTRVYHWAGDTNTVNGTVDAAELTHLADLQGFTNLADLDATNLEVV